MVTDDQSQSSPDSVPLADLSRDVEMGTADRQPESRLKRVGALLKGQFMSLCGWTLALVSTIITIITVLPTFRSEQLSEKQLKLAEWTALKDYLEECKEAAVRKTLHRIH